MVASLDVSNRVPSHAGVVRALLNARYYDATRGQFLSEDPVFWALGDKARLQQLTDSDQGSLLSNPQRVNAFSYSEDNPIIKKDPNGTFEFIPAIIAIAAIYNAAMSGVDYIDAANTDIIHYEVTTNGEKEQSTLQAGYDYTMNRVARVAAKRGYKEITPALDLYQAAYDIRTKTPDAIKYFSSGAFNSDVSSAYGSVSMSITQIAHYLQTQFSGNSTNIQSQNSGASATSGNTSGLSNSKQDTSYLAGQLGIGNTQGKFVGTYNFGPGVGTFNFGSGQWVK
jgi:hypothetical protein